MLMNAQTSPCFYKSSVTYHTTKYKLLCPRGTQTCALAVANIAHAIREMLDVAKRPIPQG